MILTHVKPRTLSSIMTLGMFLEDATEPNLYCCLDIKEQVFHFRFALGS